MAAGPRDLLSEAGMEIGSRVQTSRSIDDRGVTGHPARRILHTELRIPQLVGLDLPPQLGQAAFQEIADVIARDIQRPGDVRLAEALEIVEPDDLLLQLLEAPHHGLEEDVVL